MNNIQTKTWSKKEHLFYGIWVYRDVIKEEFDIPNRLENLISNSHLSWSEAQVGYKEKNLNYNKKISLF